MDPLSVNQLAGILSKEDPRQTSIAHYTRWTSHSVVRRTLPPNPPGCRIAAAQRPPLYATPNQVQTWSWLANREIGQPSSIYPNRRKDKTRKFSKMLDAPTKQSLYTRLITSDLHSQVKRLSSKAKRQCYLGICLQGKRQKLIFSRFYLRPSECLWKPHSEERMKPLEQKNPHRRYCECGRNLVCGARAEGAKQWARLRRGHDLCSQCYRRERDRHAARVLAAVA
jgi:hypothetical protein